MSVLSNIHVSKDQIQAFCQRYGVAELSLFGSVLRDDFDDHSDVDVMLAFRDGHGMTFENTPEILDELEALFGRRVDVVVREHLRNPIRRASILKQRQVIHAS